MRDVSPWQRMKWTGKMVKLLITILSYIGEDLSTDCMGSETKLSSLLRKKGKWKCVSKVMVARGYNISPQQCEDKFNNLNKTYRRLNDLLGRSISCKVVENPKVLDVIGVSEKVKEEVRKILTSKHLFFEELCSYHNGNRLYLPHDPDLQQSLLLILKNEDGYQFHDLKATSWFSAVSAMWLKQINENRVAGLDNEEDGSQLVCRMHRLRKRKLQLKSKVLKLEKQKFKLQCNRWKWDLELDKMRLENKRLKLRNEYAAMHLNRRRTNPETS